MRDDISPTKPAPYIRIYNSLFYQFRQKTPFFNPLTGESLPHTENRQNQQLVFGKTGAAEIMVKSLTTTWYC